MSRIKSLLIALAVGAVALAGASCLQYLNSAHASRAAAAAHR